jgi:hypothetical protein
MTIPLTGTGGVFTRLGKIAALLRAVNLFRGVGLYRVTSLVISSNVATVTTQLSHGYTSNDVITCAGVTGPGNATNCNASNFTVTVTGNTTFTFPVTASNNTATGTITVVKTGGVGFFGTGPYVDNIYLQYPTTDQNLVNGLYPARDSYRLAHKALALYLQGLAQSTVIQMANDDAPLSTQNLATALGVLISQMGTSVDTVKKPTVSAAVTAAGANTGLGQLIVSVLAGKGLQVDYPIPETITLTCSKDGQSGGTAGQEVFAVTSPVAETDLLNWDYPLGSGLNTTLSATDATLNVSGGNLLFNSSWTAFAVTNTPDKWPIKTGTAGTQIFKETGASNVYKGASSLKFLGDGSNLTAVYQPFNSSSLGTASVLSAGTVYAYNMWVKVSATPAAGVLRIALTDGADTVVNDNNSVANSATLALTGVSTTFVNLQGFFRTPLLNPTTGYRLQVSLSTALDNAKSVYMSNLALTKAVQVYPGGPFVALFSGTPNFLLADQFTIALTNKLDSQWQWYAERLLGLRALGLQLPSGGSPTIAESLIA